MVHGQSKISNDCKQEGGITRRRGNPEICRNTEEKAVGEERGKSWERKGVGKKKRVEGNRFNSSRRIRCD